MSSDEYFDDELDAAALDELDSIEAAHFPANNHPSLYRPSKHSAPQRFVNQDEDVIPDIDEAGLSRLDEFIEDAYTGNEAFVSGVNHPPRRKTGGVVQTTLDGTFLPQKAPADKTNSNSRIHSAKETVLPFGRQASKTKQWDHTAFAKTGLKRGKSKGKGADSDAEGEGEKVEFEQFPAPFIPVGPPPPMKLVPDLLEAKHWIYPLNKPKRDYQFNIVQHCLFENTLVALPTGLGKTFIAGVVMLNYYRWFPEGKIVFVAPTKPLVAQQVDACHKTCGIPGRDAVELTGNVSRVLRSRAWIEKKIFFMTPQTLVNDLLTENCDPRNIILLVVDEAHKGCGDYAYAQVVRFMMAKNPHFRILALTATPGGTPDAVQAIIDGLHISHIEIRDENSLDLKEYIYKKNIHQHVIKMNGDVDSVKVFLGKLIEADLKPLRERGILYGGDPYTMHPYRAQATMQTLKPNQKWAYSTLARLSSLCRAMGYLIEASQGMCYTYLQELSQKKEEKEGSKSGPKLLADPQFQALMTEMESQRIRGFEPHPKMDILKALILQHFGERIADQDVEQEEETRAMVFVTFRECLDEIVERLNTERPLIRATRFVGQGADRQGKKGFAQKEQLEIIKKFKDGEFNVLVATSVGEEGLDIGEVDLIVCYDAQKTPIRMLQRVGRTGRKREGNVHVLLSEGREEFNLDKAKATYKDVQKTIIRGDQLELYGDVERLLPDNVRPQFLEKVMDIEEYVRDDRTQKSKARCGRSPEGTKKRKRNDDMGRNIPEGASTGFVSAAELVVKRPRPKKAKISAKAFETAGLDDDTDREIEAGDIFARPPRRTVSAPSTKAPKSKPLRKATTMGPKRPKKKANKNSGQIELDFSQKGADDSDDQEIERHIEPSGLPTFTRISPQHKGTMGAKCESSSPCPETPTNVSVIELTSSDDGRGLSPHSPIHIVDSSPSPSNVAVCHREGRPSASPRVSSGADERGMAWLVDEDSELDFEIVESSPIRERNSGAPTRSASLAVEVGAGSDTLSTTSEQSNSSMDVVIDSVQPHTFNRIRSPSPISSPVWEFSSSPQVVSKQERPASCGRGSPVLLDDVIPEPTFAVRAPGRQKHHFVVPSSPHSPALESPAFAKRRIHRRRVTSSPDNPSSPNERQDTAPAPKRNEWIDAEAVHSGDESSSGSSHSEDDVESESDRHFLQELPETQVLLGYDQTQVYRRSLLTQAVPGSQLPMFANKPVRRGPFSGGAASTARRPILISSSPDRHSEPNEYAVGSFVVDDDAEISYDLSSDA